MQDIVDRIRAEIENIGGVGYALNGIANDLEKRVSKLNQYLIPATRSIELKTSSEALILKQIMDGKA